MSDAKRDVDRSKAIMASVWNTHKKKKDSQVGTSTDQYR
jgi:hypothetical protein